ncbi:MAG: isoleucine--tRNA ligase [Eggerthellaceae bacterium]
MANSYKKTMNLPETDFKMRGNLPENEPKRLEFWNDIDIYHKVLEKNKDNKPFVLHDGPPYANGPIHLGHAFNKILKDFVVKSHAQRGYYSPYVPGWDCHGQPIEHMVEETLGQEKMKATDTPTVRRLCREWAEKYVGIQREGFKRLGVNGEWDDPYLTFLPEYEAGNVEVFKKIYLAGNIYRGRKPIHWCKHCHTALAEAEIEYGDEKSPSLYVKFKMDQLPAIYEAAGVPLDHAYVLIWTTTAWTLPANSAVCLAPDADYCFVKVGDDYLLFAYEMVEEVAEVAGWTDYEVFTDADGKPLLQKGTQLVGIPYTCPIRQDLKGTFIYGNHVTLDSGTGAVHTAPGHGQDDYLVGMQFDVPMRMPVDDDGVLTDEAGRFAGLNVDDATPKIIEWLREEGTLVADKTIVHSYPHCWRCHEPVIFRATSQWFVDLEKNDLRKKALNAIENEVTWIPAWAANRIGSMVADRPDWCISRQRSWGVPIPVFHCAQCGEVVATEETFDAVIELFRTEGSDAWFTKKPAEYLPADTHCEKCGCKEMLPEKDILDVWWESGVSHTSVCEARDYLYRPADMYLEGSDQHRGWFQSSLLTSIGAYGIAPYKSVMHCGFTVDEQGRKMSKSLGNGVDPADVEKKYGAEILRMWVASVDYSQDVSLSDNILKRVSESYRRFRNTFRFLLGNLSDFDDRKDAVAWDDLLPVDQWALCRLAQLLDDINAGYDAYKFHNVYRAVYEYLVGDLSAVYLDALKDRLYSEAPDSPARRSAQTVLMNVLDVLVRTLAPLLSFTTEEVWQNYPQALRDRPDRPISVQLAGWPTVEGFVPAIPEGMRQKIDEQFKVVLEAREVVTKALEDARNDDVVKKSQEAVIHLAAPQAAIDALSALPEGTLEELFIVSAVSMEAADEMSATVSVSDLEKCPRCWNYRKLGGNAGHPAVCKRCGDVLDAIGYVEEE